MFFNLSIEDKNYDNVVFEILLSGDSFNITKTHVNALNFTFSLINDKDLSHKGFYILGIN